MSRLNHWCWMLRIDSAPRHQRNSYSAFCHGAGKCGGCSTVGWWLPDRESIFLPNADVMLWSQQRSGFLALIPLETLTKKKLQSNLLKLFWKCRKEKLMKDLRWNQAQKYLVCYLKYIIIHTKKIEFGRWCTAAVAVWSPLSFSFIKVNGIHREHAIRSGSRNNNDNFWGKNWWVFLRSYWWISYLAIISAYYLQFVHIQLIALATFLV